LYGILQCLSCYRHFSLQPRPQERNLVQLILHRENEPEKQKKKVV
jgi:hypothetical protein